MVDFDALRAKKAKPRAIDPEEIFRRLPKPPQINDLYTSQTEVLKGWFQRRAEKDVVIKLHTGGGKTLVGLLIAQSTMNETDKPVLYLAPNNQLVNQTLQKAEEYGIPAKPYESGRPLNEDFLNGKAVLVASYKALFNGKSKFKLAGSISPIEVGAVILDDAHVAFADVRSSFTVEVQAQSDRETYKELAGIFRQAFDEGSQLGTFDDVLSGEDFTVLEVPYWAWKEKIAVVREALKNSDEDHSFAWPLIRDHLHLCHAFISRRNFTITPILPLIDAFPTFFGSPRRIYMSATISDDSELIRTFDADPKSVSSPLASRSLAGVSERMILIPEVMDYGPDVAVVTRAIASWAAGTCAIGTVILTPSNKIAQEWSDIATVAQGPEQVQELVAQLQTRAINGPVAFANRYDGIDLPGESCRLLIVDGEPIGTSDYELFRASILQGGATVARMLAQRIEQGIGRAARGAGDFCVVLLVGSDLAAWISRESNFRFLTTPTKAQLEMGSDISKAIKTDAELAQTINYSFTRDAKWTSFHAETLAELVDESRLDETHIPIAAEERKSINLWKYGYHEKAIDNLQHAIEKVDRSDIQLRGWLTQLCGRIADQWGNDELAEKFQQSAYAQNRILQRPKTRPPYRPMPAPDSQAAAITENFQSYLIRRGLEQQFETIVAKLHPNASSSQFEQALSDLGHMIGFSAERFDKNGKGPDVLWLLPGNVGVVIEAKSRKKAANLFTKDNHGQLLVAQEWFSHNYPDRKCIRVCVHQNHLSTDAAEAADSFVLTYDNLQALVAEARRIIQLLSRSKLPTESLAAECARELAASKIRSDEIARHYLIPFTVVAKS